jgi:hypothetical protein
LIPAAAEVEHMRRWFKVLSLGFGMAGMSKIMALPPQRRLFRSWGWPEDTMLIIGGLEMGGALLMSARRTRHIGAATVAATSVAVLAAELEHGQSSLAPARWGFILAALTGMV